MKYIQAATHRDTHIYSAYAVYVYIYTVFKPIFTAVKYLNVYTSVCVINYFLGCVCG